jgi:cyanophycinase
VIKRPGFGTLVIIGGAEEKAGDRVILRYIAKRLGRGKLVVSTVASEVPGTLWNEYEKVFRSMGIRHLHHLNVQDRGEAMEERALRTLDDADAVFFTGGDQLRITSVLGDTPVYNRVKEIYESGGLIAGTSAGASVMTETMMVSGDSEASLRVKSGLRMAPGFGLLQGVVVDQHFAQRGRLGRLVTAIAQNPRMLGIGLDEDAAVIYQRQRFQVIGTNAVHIVDASKVTFTNIAENEPDMPVGIYGVRLHLMNMGDKFDCRTRRPKYVPKEIAFKQWGLAGLDEEPEKKRAAESG